MATVPDSLERFDPHRLWQRWTQRRTRLILAWTVALLVTLVASGLAWFNCRDAGRADGNWGHRNIDFSGQWLLAALFASGEGRYLYNREHQEALLKRAYPHEREDPKQTHDAEQIFEWLMHPDGESASLSGPLYPPVHGLLFAPLGYLPPQPAYRVMQAFNLLLTFLAAWLIERLTKGGVWLPVALAVLFLYPGHSGGFHLGQNPILTLTLLLLGWKLQGEGHPLAGGLVWGMLAFKPVWAVAFLLVPLLTRRWRFALGMMLMGGALVLATLPFTGLQPWFDWLKIGDFASQRYSEIRNWIFLSRDLIGIPRRWLYDFNGDWVSGTRYGPWPDVLGVLLWISVPLTTVIVCWSRRREPAPLTGPGAAFVLLGAFFSCYHFMYYDVLLTVLPLTLLFMEPVAQAKTWWARGSWAPPLPWLVLAVLLIAPPIEALLVPTHLYPPLDEFALLALWAWCGWQWRVVDSSGVLG